MTKQPNITLFLAVFLVALLIHSSYFRQIAFADNLSWIKRTANLTHDMLTWPIQINFYDANHNFRYGAHPGTTILMLSATMYKMGLSGSLSLLFAITFLTAFLTAAIATTCHYLRPYSPWWLVAAITLLVHPLYFYGTPTNVVIGPTIALLFLLALVVYEQRAHPLPIRLALFISFVIGMGLSTRLPDTVFIAVPLIAFIGAYISNRRLVFIVLASIFFAFIFNPFYWFLPIEYIKTIILRTASHIIYTSEPGLSITIHWALFYTPLTIISITVAIVSLISARRHLPVSVPFLLTLLLITAITTGLFLTAKFKTLRYYFPLIFIWDILLPLFLLKLSDAIQLPFPNSFRSSSVTRQLMRSIILAIIVFGFAFLTAYNLTLPGSQGLI